MSSTLWKWSRSSMKSGGSCYNKTTADLLDRLWHQGRHAKRLGHFASSWQNRRKERRKTRRKVTLVQNHFGFARPPRREKEKKIAEERKKDKRRQGYLGVYHYGGCPQGTDQYGGLPMRTVGKDVKGVLLTWPLARMQWSGK